jgi:Uma2 family endonuclease
MTRTAHRQFAPGTTGWTVDDFADPGFTRQCGDARLEIVDGVLTTLAPQGFGRVAPLSALRVLLERERPPSEANGVFFPEADVRLRHNRVARPDMTYLTQDQIRQQHEAERREGVASGDYTPVLVTPLLVVESVSKGHEAHDRATKRAWYAETGVRHYWLLTHFERSLVCLTLAHDAYVEEAAGRDSEVVRSALFGGVVIPLDQMWGDVGG